ncbi:permease [Polychytrium aggregatum]|uniref:permease n=1 Tax=Polychytrium aggregatum TaxID=110093 RepID=UPI0022FE688E|nr:permease [Polychytrium aggregatum]KAI9193653.1 permease [Polychytrium aggregatum]
MGIFDSLNKSVASSFVGRYFKLDDGSGRKGIRPNTSFTTELRAGLATFVTMAYIISVNANILSDSGGPCGCTSSPDTCLKDPNYQLCLNDIKKDFITATSAAAAIATFLMGAMANLPLGLAPGMGLNAYFAYQVVGFQGSGKIPYRTAVAAVFIEGILFIVISLLGLRQLLAKAVPKSVKIATGAGIGLFLTFIGLQNSAGIGLVTYDPATLVTIGGCADQYKDPTSGQCLSHGMESGTTWIGIFGFVIIALLASFRVKGGILIGIVFISAISWFRNTSITAFPATPAGDAAFDFFKTVVAVPQIRRTGLAMDWNLGTSEVWVALVTFLYVDIMDTTGTLYSMAKFAGFADDRTGDFEGSFWAFLADATSISLGALFGSSPNTAFIESGAGIAEGGRTGLTAITTAFFFVLSLFFAPIFASFPRWATGPALIFVGVLMAKGSLRSINWDYLPDAIPAFLTMALMPLTYSIAYGLIAGIGAYIAIHGTIYLVELVSGGRIKPTDKDMKEMWGTENSSDMLPPWMKVLLRKFGKLKETNNGALPESI